MTIICNVTGSERKRLAQALGAILLWEPVYQGAPSFGYAVGNYTVDRNGTISCPDSATPEIVAQIISKLTGEGFAPEISGDEAPADNPAETPDVAPEAEAEAMPEAEATEANVGAETPDTAAETAGEDPSVGIPETAESEADQSAAASATEDDHPSENTADESNVETTEDETKLTVNIPRDKLTDEALARLRIMVSNKEVLFKRALLADALPINASEDKVSFPWFTLMGTAGEAEAYAQFITCLCKMAIEQTRVLDKPYDGDNDRFAMRIFMVRLGMKGTQFALARKLMMKNLTGNSGWRYGATPKNAEETSVATADVPETTATDTPPDAEAMEDPVISVPEETSDAITEDISSEGESVPDEVVPDPVEAASTDDVPSDENVAAEEN